ncbi:MAG TPA: BrnT family toxin [Terriglobales bacterium]|jgi:uncharacterized DUF497 family protein|nr:BrnT family toxin [Terriglobales bacterium]
MRFRFDERKSGRLRANPKRGIGSEEVQEVFSHPYYLDQRSDWPEQYRAIGWVNEHLYTVIFEVREDEDGEYYHLVTLRKATRQEQQLYEEHS